VRTQAPKQILLSGDIERGKTRICMQVAEGLRAQGWDIAGILSPAVWEASEKIAIEAIDLGSGEVRRLANRYTQADNNLGPKTKRWQFNADTLAWCNQVFDGIGSCDLLIVDELGPLEFERGEGMLAAFDVLEAGNYRLALVVVRPSLLAQAMQRWPAAIMMNIDDPGQVDKLTRGIMKLVELYKP
jgi:nucleoside-triphosphatase THEP1